MVNRVKSKPPIPDNYILEGDLKKKIKEHLTKIGAYWHMPVPWGYGKQSVDFICCFKGAFLAIETKTTGKEPTARQHACMKEIRKAGGVAFWCDTWESYLQHIALEFYDGLPIK